MAKYRTVCIVCFSTYLHISLKYYRVIVMLLFSKLIVQQLKPFLLKIFIHNPTKKYFILIFIFHDKVMNKSTSNCLFNRPKWKISVSMKKVKRRYWIIGHHSVNNKSWRKNNWYFFYLRLCPKIIIKTVASVYFSQW